MSVNDPEKINYSQLYFGDSNVAKKCHQDRNHHFFESDHLLILTPYRIDYEVKKKEKCGEYAAVNRKIE